MIPSLEALGFVRLYDESDSEVSWCPFIELCVSKQEATGPRKASVLFGPRSLHPSSLYEPAVLTITACLQAPAAYTLKTVH